MTPFLAVSIKALAMTDILNLKYKGALGSFIFIKGFLSFSGFNIINHCETLILCSYNHVCVNIDECLGSLSCWFWGWMSCYWNLWCHKSSQEPLNHKLKNSFKVWIIHHHMLEWVFSACSVVLLLWQLLNLITWVYNLS